MNELSHIELIEFKKEKRLAKKVNERNERKFDDINWELLYHEWKLYTVLVSEINEFLIKNKLAVETKLSKKEKIGIIEAEISKTIAAKIHYRIVSEDEIVQEAESDSDNKEEVQLDIDNSDVDTSSSDSSDDEEVTPTLSRYGRKQGSWKTKKNF